MLDLFLAYSLLKAIADDSQLLLVGDIDQLPTVGPGQILSCPEVFSFTESEAGFGSPDAPGITFLRLDDGLFIAPPPA